MAQAIEKIDITDVPALRRIAEEVRDRQEPIALRAEGADVAVVMPLGDEATVPTRRLSQADYDAVMSAAGSWRGLVDDVDKLKADLKAARGSNRPPVELRSISSIRTG